jgi:hypothetical protein
MTQIYFRRYSFYLHHTATSYTLWLGLLLTDRGYFPVRGRGAVLFDFLFGLLLFLWFDLLGRALDMEDGGFNIDLKGWLFDEFYDFELPGASKSHGYVFGCCCRAHLLL